MYTRHVTNDSYGAAYGHFSARLTERKTEMEFLAILMVPVIIIALLAMAVGMVTPEHAEKELVARWTQNGIVGKSKHWKG